MRTLFLISIALFILGACASRRTSPDLPLFSLLRQDRSPASSPSSSGDSTAGSLLDDLKNVEIVATPGHSSSSTSGPPPPSKSDLLNDAVSSEATVEQDAKVAAMLYGPNIEDTVASEVLAQAGIISRSSTSTSSTPPPVRTDVSSSSPPTGRT